MCVAWWQKEKLQFSSMLDKWRQNNPTKSCCHLNFMFRLVDTKLKPDGYLEVIQHTTLSGGSFDLSCSMSLYWVLLWVYAYKTPAQYLPRYHEAPSLVKFQHSHFYSPFSTSPP